jgi:opacity protein-like surface antigen
MIFSSAVALAAPQTDFKQGKTSVDLGAIRSEIDADGIDFDKKTNLDLGITTGLSDKFALQYKFQKLEGDTNVFGPTIDTDNKVHELNVLYKIDPNVYAFAGIQRLSGNTKLAGVGSFDIDSKTVAQIGVTGVTQLADKLNGWATAAIGNDNYSYEIGLGYEIANNADLNLFYRYKKFNDIEFKSGLAGSGDAKSKGVGAGVTFRF